MELILITKISAGCANIVDSDKRRECITKSEGRIEGKYITANPDFNNQILYKKPNSSIFLGPLNESFTGTTFPPNGWQVFNADGGSQTWDRYTSNCRTAPGCASVRWESSTLANNDWLITPPLVILNVTPPPITLSFSYRTSTTTNMNPTDSLVLYISNDDGLTWNKIWEWDGSSSTTPVNVSIDITSYLNNTILLRFAFFDNQSTADAANNYFNIDSLKITAGAYQFLIESWTASAIFLSAGYDTTNATTTRRWQRRTTACPFTESTTACAGYAYTETGTTTGYAYLTSPKIYLSSNLIGFWYQSQSTTYIDSFDVYILTWNNQPNLPTPSDFINFGTRIDTKYPRTGTSGLPYIYTAYDLRADGASVGDTVYVAIRYKAFNQYRLYIDDVVSYGANTPDLPPSISLITGARYHFYNNIPDTVKISVSDDGPPGSVSCYLGYRYVINPNQEGNSPSGPFTEYAMTQIDAPGFPDTFVYVISLTDRGLRGNYYIKCTDQGGNNAYIPSGAPTSNWYVYNILPSGKFAQKYQFIDEERIRQAFIRNNIDLQPDLLLSIDSTIWIDSLTLWNRIYWHQNSTSDTRRNKIKTYLDGGTCTNRRAIVWFGNDMGYHHDREGATYRDTILTRNYLHFRYVSDDWTNSIDNDTVLGISGKPIFGDMTYEIYTNDLYPDDIRPYPAGDENTSVPILYVKNGDSTISNPSNPSIASVFYNGLGYYSIFGSFSLNYLATYDAFGQSRIDTLIRRIHNFIPVSTCLDIVQAYDDSINLPADGINDQVRLIVRVQDPTISSPSDLRVYLYYRKFSDPTYNVVLASYDSSNASGYFFSAIATLVDNGSSQRDSLDFYFTAHKMTYGVYGPANNSNNAKFIYEYDALNAPLNFQVIYRDQDSVVLDWDPPSLFVKGNKNEILAFQQYVLEYSPDNVSWSTLATINDINITNYTHTFATDSEYINYYRIKVDYTSGSSGYVYTNTTYDILAPRKIYADTFDINISGSTLTGQIKALFEDLSPIVIESLYYKNRYSPWTSKYRDNVISDTSIYNITITGIGPNDTLYFYFLAVDAYDNIRITDTTIIPIVSTILADIPKKFDIIYKNGLLTFALPKQSLIKLQVYSVSGRAVININSNYSAGYVRFDLNKLPKGAYIIRAETENIKKEFKTVIIR